jgi:hypothetical protein
MDRQAKIRLLILGTLAALAAGCTQGGAKSSADAGAAVTHPGGDNGCPLVDGCDGPLELLSTVTIETTPPVTSLSTRQYRSGVPYSSGAYLELRLAPTVTLCGEIRGDTPNLAGAVFASVVGDLPEAAAYQTAITPDRRFCIKIPTGDFRLQCVPDDQDTPPLSKSVHVEKGTRSTDFNYPSGDSVIEVSGRLIITAANPVGVDNIYVKAYDSATGIASNTAVTSEAISDGVGGLFTLTIPARTGTYSITVSPTSINPDWPSMTFPDIITGPVSGDLVLEFGNLPPVYSVRGSVANAPALAGALVEFSADMGKGSIYKSVMTGAAADFTTTLRQGKYRIMLTPPTSNAKLGATITADVTIPPDSGELLLQAGIKREIKGTVKYPDGAPGSGVAVTARRTGGCAGESSSGSEVFGISAGASGSYSLTVDEGSYEISFSPPEGVLNAGIEKRALCVKGVEDLSVTLPRTVLVTGVVLDSSDIPVGNATLGFYLHHASTIGNPVFVGYVTTATDGSFIAPLPDIAYKP